MELYAHTKPDTGPEEWQLLEEHLSNVAALAGGFAAKFGAQGWGELLGRLHDIGKARPTFQKKLVTNSSSYEDHKGVGARLCWEMAKSLEAALILAYCVAGHHTGLPDYSNSEHGTSLKETCSKSDPLPDSVESPFVAGSFPPLPFPPKSSFQLSFFTRMLLSSLVDADYLDTEQFMDPEKASLRLSSCALSELVAPLNAHLAQFSPTGKLNALRTEILAHCRAQAQRAPGLFSLTVPTGGGKTLTSMAFALDHAIEHGLERVIYVIPYTSIIEQNAEVFRSIFPAGTVVEHHSTFNEEKLDQKETIRESLAAQRHRLACENWDAPVIVTTAVQFFESLFAAKPSKCRKLHNLANAIIILDEAHMLPCKFLLPCLRGLEALAQDYGSSVVLCTATQPSLEEPELKKGLKNVEEIAPDPMRMHAEFRRTRLENVGDKSLEDVAEMVQEHSRVLCIVNTRQRSRDLYKLVKEAPGVFCLSALMCPAHRSHTLAKIRATLAGAQEPCRVVSTQLIEAGVDVSFPVVMREKAGLDSIIQAAGRCNREAESDSLAPVYVFNPTEGVVSAFSRAAGSLDSMLGATSQVDPFSPEAARMYFSDYYGWEGNHLDELKILENFESNRGQWSFAKAAAHFRIIDNIMMPILIPYDQEAEKLVDALYYAEHSGGILRQLQQCTVQIYEAQFKALDNAGAVELVNGLYPVLRNMDYYDDRIGLLFPVEASSNSNFIF